MNKINKKAIFNNLDSFLDFVRQFAEHNDLKKQFLLDLTLIIEELLVNIISYGYPHRENHGDIELRLSHTIKAIKIVLIDDGIPFNILDVEEPNISLSLVQRNLGGMGIHFVKTLTNKIKYTRRQGKNILILTKNIDMH